MNLSAVILAGGESRRMGRDKAWLSAGGQSLLARALATLRQAGLEQVWISGRAETDYSELGCPVLFDRAPGRGPLAGIERGLEEAATPHILVLAVDMPNMTAAFVQKLAGQCDPLTGVVPEVRRQLEPLAAIYPRRCRMLAADCLRQGQRAARDFAAACLREGAVRRLVVPSAEAVCFDNWNTPADATAPLVQPISPVLTPHEGRDNQITT